LKTLDEHLKGVHYKIKEFQCNHYRYASAQKGSIKKHESIVHKKLLPFEFHIRQKVIQQTQEKKIKLVGVFIKA